MWKSCYSAIYSVINSEYEYIALHRDVGETELKQVGIEIVRRDCIVTFDAGT